MVKSVSALATALALLVGCGSSDGGASTPAVVTNAPPGTPTETKTSAAETKEQLGGTAQSNGQTGKLVYSMEPLEDETDAAAAEAIFHAEIVTGAITSFNELFTFPTDVPVVAKSCGRVNASYDPTAHSVSLCYELAAEIHKSMSAKLSSQSSDEQLATTANAMAFVLLHEVGHAFLGENHIAVLGKEEDVVDDISSVLFVTAQKPEVPLYGTIGLVTITPDSKSFSDEHSFSLQRYFGALCLIYGSAPAKFPTLIGAESEYKLPKERAVRCPGEWAQKVTALKTIVAPFIRK